MPLFTGDVNMTAGEVSVRNNNDGSYMAAFVAEQVSVSINGLVTLDYILVAINEHVNSLPCKIFYPIHGI